MKETFLLPRHRGKIRVALCFPSTYSAGMSSLAFQKLVALFSVQNFTTARFFIEKSSLYSPDNVFSLAQADYVVFTISYEPDIINVLLMLSAAGIPFEKNNRTPILIAGGIFPTINDTFLSDIFDFQYRGEIEENENEFIELLQRDMGRSEIIEKLNLQFGDKVHIYNPFSSPPYSVILSPEAGFSDSFLIEISRGCLFRCPFCMVSKVYEKFRPAPYEKITELIDIGLKYTKKIGLVSALPNSHPQIKQIAHYILKNGGVPSFSSLRAELIDEDFMDILKLSGQKTMTLAIEAGDENVRNTIGKAKDITVIKKVIAFALDRDIRNFKLYFMAGLPGDTGGAAAVADYCLELRKCFGEYAKTRGIMPAISVDVSQFVPKPLTAWENEKMMDKKQYNDFLVALRKRVAPKGIVLRSDDAYMAELQFVISRGGKKLASELCAAIRTDNSVKKIIKTAIG